MPEIKLAFLPNFACHMDKHTNEVGRLLFTDYKQLPHNDDILRLCMFCFHMAQWQELFSELPL